MLDEEVIDLPEFNCMFISNTQYCAGGMKASPLAKIDDGYLDVNLIYADGYMEYLKTFQAFVRDGAHVFMEDVCRQYRACDIKISLGDGCECMNVEGIVC